MRIQKQLAAHFDEDDMVHIENVARFLNQIVDEMDCEDVIEIYDNEYRAEDIENTTLLLNAIIAHGKDLFIKNVFS